MFNKFTHDLMMDIGILFMRVMIGTVFLFHGGQKLFGLWDGSGLGNFAAFLENLGLPYPAVAAVLAGTAEFLGGISLITGIWMRFSIVPLLVTMGVAIVYVHPNSFSMQENGMEYPLTLAGVLLGLLLTGPGSFHPSVLFTPRRVMVMSEPVEA